MNIPRAVMMKLVLTGILLLGVNFNAPASARMTQSLALDGSSTTIVTVYSTLDASLAAPLVEGFQIENPGVTVHYFDLLASEISRRIIKETEAGEKTADLAFSSAMDLQVKLANDGYARRVSIPNAYLWPDWAKWRETAFALTFEPGVIVWHKPSFPDGPPRSRLELIKWLANRAGSADIGTYDVERSTVGFLYLARDAEHFAGIWSLLRSLDKAGLRIYSTSRDIIERVTSGELVLGYNILGSYAMEQAKRMPDLGVVLPTDYTVVVSRIGLVPNAAARPDLGARFLSYLMSKNGQTIMAEKLQLAAISPEVEGPNTAKAMSERMGSQLKPVPVSPGLLAYIDQANRMRLLGLWHDALRR